MLVLGRADTDGRVADVRDPKGGGSWSAAVELAIGAVLAMGVDAGGAVTTGAIAVVVGKPPAGPVAFVDQ